MTDPAFCQSVPGSTHALQNGPCSLRHSGSPDRFFLFAIQMLQAGLTDAPDSAGGWLAVITLRQGLGPAAPPPLAPNPGAALAAANAALAHLAQQQAGTGGSRALGQAATALRLLRAWALLEQGEIDSATDDFQELIGE